jgi:hypothetical protein
MDDRGFESWQVLGTFLYITASRRALGPTQPPIQKVLRDLSLVSGAIPPLTQYAVMVWCSVEAQGQHYL